MADRRIHKRSLRLAGQRTSLALEPEYWRLLGHSAALCALTVPELVALIDNQRDNTRRTSLAHAVRIFLFAQAW